MGGGGALVRWYISKLTKHQVTTNMLTTGTVFFLGDLVSQQLVERKGKAHELERTARSVAVGSLYIAPLITFLYNFVDKVFGPSQNPLTAVKKVGLISLFTPLTVGGYVIFNNIFQAKPLDHTLHQLRYDLLTMVLMGYKIWLPTHFFLLTVIPLRHRVLVSNFVGVLWTGYLTYAANKDTRESKILAEGEIAEQSEVKED